MIVDIEASESFCLTDLQNDHNNPEFKANVFSAFYSDSDKIVVNVGAIY